MEPQGYQPRDRNGRSRKAGLRKAQSRHRALPGGLVQSEPLAKPTLQRNSTVVDIDDRSGKTLDVSSATVTAVVSGTTIERPKTIGAEARAATSASSSIAGNVSRTSATPLTGRSLKQITPRRIRVTENPEHARQEDAATVRHKPRTTRRGRPRSRSDRARRRSGPETREQPRRRHRRARAREHRIGRTREARGAAPRERHRRGCRRARSKLGYPAGQTAALQGGVVDRPGLRRDLPCKSGERTRRIRSEPEPPERREMKDTGRELGQVGRTRPPRPRARSAKRHDRRSGTGSGSDTRRRRSIGSSGRTPRRAGRRERLGNRRPARSRIIE